MTTSGRPEPRVLVPNLSTRWDIATGQRVPTLDLNPASEFGEIVVMTEGPVDRNSINGTIKELMAHDVRPEDVILPVGNPLLTAAVVTRSIQLNGLANCLFWDRRTRAYSVQRVYF